MLSSGPATIGWNPRMTGPKQPLTMEDISPEARRAAAEAAEAAGMPLDIWLGQLIKYVSAMEKKGRDEEDQAPAAAAATPESEAASPPAAEDAAAQLPDDTDSAAPAEPIPGTESARDGEAAPAIASESIAAAPADSAPEAPAAPTAAVAAGQRQAAGDQWSVGMAAVDSLRPSRFSAEWGQSKSDIERAIDIWRRDGGIEPIVVRHDPVVPGAYEIIAGADRWEAARQVEIKEVPILIKELSDDETLKAVLIQQLRRRSVSPIEEAEIYRRLLDQAALSVAELAKTVGCAQSRISQSLQLLDLPSAVQDLVRQGELTLLHARALLDAANPEALAREVVARRLDIYQTEQLVRSSGDDGPARRPDNANDNMATAQILERQLSLLLGLKVSIAERGGVGVLSLHYTNRDQLSEVITRLNSAGG